ncbi:uncharacterized protein [Aegilops tauschii subsp. strangulata]|uniref:uncharacterized protein n=1 Tax=Aegilops tauschii subsp. strangulata TaxID=200361 RepID=UPI001ABCFF38|nr:uncharacterized protein LOC109736563 [Aegilops tauschii subsp. strangulata]
MGSRRSQSKSRFAHPFFLEIKTSDSVCASLAAVIDLQQIRAIDMEARTDRQPPSGDPPPGQPRWVLLQGNMICEDPAARATTPIASDDLDAETVADALTSGGRNVRVSFHLAAPPAVSRLRVDIPGLPDGTQLLAEIIAANADSVLIEVETSRPGRFDTDKRDSLDYFVYNAGAAAADPSRPPSLSLLPPYHKGSPRWKRLMPAETTGLLRRGDEDLLVARLTLNGTEGEAPLEAELCLLRSGEWEWKLKRLPVLHGDGKRKEVSFWETDAVIPVGDRFLYWVDYYRGIIFSDAWEETPQLRYVSLPVEPLESRPDDHDGGSSYRGVCATDGGGAVSFVEVFPRCCCGCPGATFCSRSRYAFNITTWALRMDDDLATWDKVGVVDSDELWSLPGYSGVVPRITPEYPIVSLDDPDVLCFMVHKLPYHMEDVDGDHAIRMIEVDTNRMELRSVVCYDEHDDGFCSPPEFFPCMISRYFDASSRSCRPPAKLHEQAPMAAAATIINELNSSDNKAAMASPGEMLATLREIGDLERDDMLRTYSVLVCDGSQFKFRSLLALPKDMRKDYCLLLMENRL